jgi:hypothetical protein
MKTYLTLVARWGAAASVMMAMAFASSVSAQGKQNYQVGDSVECLDPSGWHKATIIKVGVQPAAGTQASHYRYQVEFLGYGKSVHWFIDSGDFRSEIRPAGSGPTEPVPTPYPKEK